MANINLGNGISIELSTDNLSALEACTAEDLYGSNFDTWIADLFRGKLRAVLVLITVLGQRSNPNLSFADVGSLNVAEILNAFAQLPTTEAEPKAPEPTVFLEESAQQ